MASTIKDIANALGLSPSTISRALNNHPKISEETKNMVKKLAKRMNYNPNKAAAGLRLHKTYCIGLIVPNISTHFYSTIISGVQQVALSNGYQLLIGQSNEKEQEEINYINAFMSGRVDGLLICISKETKYFDHITTLLLEEIPVVLLDRAIDEIDAVTIEAKDYEGSYKATNHLIKRGCNHIAHLSGTKQLLNSQRRLNGYKDALVNNGFIPNTNMIIDCDWNKENVNKAIQQLFRYNPELDGIFAANDDLAVESIIQLRKLNIQIPKQVSVVGFGNNPIGEIVYPSLTTIKQHPRRIGANASHKLISLIDENYKDYKEEFITCDLIKRDST